MPLRLVTASCPLLMQAAAARQRKLRRASRVGDVDAIRALVAEGADVNGRDVKGNSALMLAAHCGHIDAIRALAAAGAGLECKDKNGSTAAILAVHAGQTDALRCLVKELGVEVEACDKSGSTALIHAAKRGALLEIDLLVASGAQPSG